MSDAGNELEIEKAKVNAICESAREAIITGTLDGIVTGWNIGAERMFGYRAEETIGKSFTIVIPPEDRKREHEIFERLRQGERTADYETRRIHKDGHIIEISATFSPIRDGIGRIVGVVTVANDIRSEEHTSELQ